MKKLNILLIISAVTLNISGAKGAGESNVPSPATNGAFLSQSAFAAVGTSTHATQAITTAGVFVLSGDLVYTAPGAGDIIIDIQADNVTLDLNQKKITSAKASTNLTAVNVASGVQNVVIRNGKIQNIEGTGIIVNSSCQNIRIENVFLESCDYGGISISSSNNVVISSVNSVNNTNPTGATVYGISLTSSGNVTVDNCKLDNNGTSGVIGLGIDATSCENCEIRNCDLSANVGTSAYGARLTSCTGMTVYNCTAKNNQATTGTAAGFYLNATTDSFVGECLAQYNRATSAGGNAYGLYSTGGTSNAFNRCVGSGQNATTGIAFGGGLDSSETLSTISNSKFYGNRVTGAGQAYGVRLASSGASVTKCSVKGCDIRSNNATTTGAVLAGLRDWSTDCTSLISGNTLALNGNARINVGSAPNYDIDASDLTIDGSGNGGLNLYLTYADSKNVVDILVESDISNLQAVSTALQGWTNILIVPSQEI